MAYIIVGVVVAGIGVLVAAFVRGGKANTASPLPDHGAPMIGDAVAQVEVVSNVAATLAVPEPGMRLCLRYTVKLREFFHGHEPFGLVATIRGCGLEHERVLGLDAKGTGTLPVWGTSIRRYGKRNGGERTEATVVAELSVAGDVSIAVAPTDGTALIQAAAFLLR
jgi:hypothetical protein